MANGPVTEGVKVAGSLVDVLRTQPSTVAMIVISFGLLGYVFYEARSFNALKITMTEMILDHTRETNLILSKCVVQENVAGQLESNRRLLDALAVDTSARNRELDAMKLLPGPHLEDQIKALAEKMDAIQQQLQGEKK